MPKSSGVVRAEIAGGRSALDAASADLVQRGLVVWTRDAAARPVLVVRGQANLLDDAALAETNRSPFDLPEAESELVAGFMVEYSSTPYLLFMAGEYIAIFLMCALISLLFFGGWLSPIPGLADGWWWMIAKMAFFFFLFAMVKAISTDQVQALTTAQVAALTTGQIVNLLTSQVAALKDIQVAALETADLAAISSTGIRGLTTAQVVSLESADFAVLTTAQVAEGDTLFVFARTTDGAGLPVAVKRLPAAGFPLQLTLSDADGLMPAQKLSGQDRVVLMARVSRSGDAGASPGDLEADVLELDVADGATATLRIATVRP